MSAAQPVAEAPSSTGGADFTFTDGDFRTIAGIMHELTGVFLPEGKRALIYSRLVKRLRALKMQTFADYCDYLQNGDNDEEVHEFITALTTNVTRFFREPHHFDHLKTVVLPPLLSAAKAGGRIRLWSAGCSSGEEPYSIALTVLELEPNAGNLDIKILASDVNPQVLGKAREGVYSAEDLSAAPDALRSKYFQAAEQSGFMRANAKLQSLISFREHNLNQAWPMNGPFDAIFCRNVVIYFQEDMRQGLWTKFVDRLTKEGRLFIGHSERVTGPATNRLVNEAVTTYRVK